ncbi:PfkB family carbohydrate kinase [Geminicoccaceae bacterium 1502E]|nr:PfkB family carbohydrate kinase [Geminicoccaceae bacterium 1502E]
MTRVLCVGHAVLDQVFDFAALPLQPGKHLARGYRMVGGGMAANAACAVARLGAEALLMSRIGGDPAGAAILAELDACGVASGAVERVAGLPSSISAIAVAEDGERLLFNHTDPRLLEAAPAPAEASFGFFDALMADCRWPAAAAAGLELARRRGVPAVADIDHPLAPAFAARILEAASHVVFSRDGLKKATGCTGVEEGLAWAAARTGGLLAVTLGADGVLWRDGKRLELLPGFAVTAVDTMGAGDAFHGALALALAEGQAWTASLRFAAATAALKVTRPGGREAYPGRAEVEALLGSP